MAVNLILDVAPGHRDPVDIFKFSHDQVELVFNVQALEQFGCGLNHELALI
jgi:hypothetical protein